MALTQERLKELLTYSPETGLFYWKEKRGRAAAGSEAGCKASNGYIYIRIDDVLYLAQRLAFLFMNGSWPAEHVDHINGMPDDNKWPNLRECDRSQNMCNSKKRSNSASPFKGIYLHKASGLWHARVQKRSRVFSLGYFNSPEIAAAAYDAAATGLHGEFARVNGG